MLDGMSEIHIYVHVPFCIDTCGYCDFYRKPYREDKENLYVTALLAEIDLRVPRGAVISSLYFGGGTPSLLGPKNWESIFCRFSKHSTFAEDSEISIEANPASISKDSIRLWSSFGINRVSVGVQSLNDRILRFLNRLHTSEEAIRAMRILSDADSFSVNADLIYGIPGLTVEECVMAVDRLAPILQHLSAYCLTVEPATPFGLKGIEAAKPDEAAEQYEIIARKALTHGLERYEVSNFAGTGHECRHNLNTWRYGTCIGLGPSAVGFDGRRRYKNIPDLGGYTRRLHQGQLPQAEEETIHEEISFRDRLMLGLRMREGVELPEAEAAAFRSMIEESDLANCFEWTGVRARLTDGRVLLLDEILTRIGVLRKEFLCLKKS